MKKALCLVLALLMIFSVTACNNNANTGDQVKLGIPGGKSLVPQEVIDGFLAEYSGKYNVIIEDTPWGEFQTKLNLGIASGTAPALYLMDSGYVSAAGYKGSAIDLKPLIEKDLNKDDFVSALFSGTDKDGNIWGVPHAMNAVCMFYNKDLFDKYGVEYPTADWTWDEMVDKAKKLSVDEDGDGMNESYGLGWATNITCGWLPMMLSYGLEPISEDYTKAQFDAPGIKNAWDQILTWRDEMGIMPTADWSSLYPSFHLGKLGMNVQQVSQMKAITENAPDLNWDIQVLPAGPNGNNNAVFVPNMWSIYSKADAHAQEVAWEFIKYYYNEESQNICAQYLLGGFPIRKSALENLPAGTPENKKGIVEGIDQRGHTLCEGPGWSEWRTAVDKAFTDYVSETPTKDRDQILKDTQAEVQKVLDAENAALAE